MSTTSQNPRAQIKTIFSNPLDEEISMPKNIETNNELASSTFYNTNFELLNYPSIDNTGYPDKTFNESNTDSLNFYEIEN